MLLGATLSYTYYFPDLFSEWDEPDSSLDFTVSNAVEITDLYDFDDDAGDNQGNFVTIDFDSDTITVDFTIDGQWTPSDFNGFVVEDIYDEIPDITGITIVDQSLDTLFDPQDITFAENSISVNWEAMTFSAGSQLVLQLTFDDAPLIGSDAFFDETGGKLVTMATLAKASYRLSSADVADPFVNDPGNSVADAAYQTLTGSSNFRLLTSADISLLSDDGYFVSSQVDVPNAAALVGETNDALFVSFRGTNDGDRSNDETPQFTTAVNANSTPQIRGLINAAERIGDNGGQGTGVYTAVSQTLSLDQQDWFDLLGSQGGSHFDQLRPMIDAALDYMAASNLSTLYVSGHSLGAGMAQTLADYLDGDPRAAGIEIDIVTFANPGSSLIDFYGDNITLTNFWNESDPINWTDAILATPGDENIIRTTNSGESVDLLTDGGHNMDAYLRSMELLSRAGIDFDEISEAGSDYDDFYVSIIDIGTDFVAAENSVVFSTRSDLFIDEVVIGGRGDDELFTWGGDDVLAGLEGSDYLQGGAGSDRFVFHIDERGFTTDTVGFFVDGQDLLDLTNIDITFDELEIDPLNGDAIVNIRDEMSIVVQNFDAGLLGADDFLFV